MEINATAPCIHHHQPGRALSASTFKNSHHKIEITRDAPVHQCVCVPSTTCSCGRKRRSVPILAVTLQTLSFLIRLTGSSTVRLVQFTASPVCLLTYLRRLLPAVVVGEALEICPVNTNGGRTVL